MRQNAGFQKLRRPQWSVYAVVPAAALAVLTLGLIGCGGQTAKIVTPPSVSEVHTYAGVPGSPSSGVGGIVTIDRTADRVTALQPGLPPGPPQPEPTNQGTFTASQTGFLTVAETFGQDQASMDNILGSTAFPCPVLGSWGVEIPGEGALVNLTFLSSSISTAQSYCSSPQPVPPASAVPILVAESSNCPNFAQQVTFAYVTIPLNFGMGTVVSSSVDYGIVGVSNVGNSVTFQAQPFVVGQPALPPSTVTGGCSILPLGVSLTAYPLNQRQAAASPELFSFSPGGLLVDEGDSATGTQNGALGQNPNSAGAIGVVMPSSPVDAGAIVGAKYNGFLYAPGDSLSFLGPPGNNDGDGNPITFDASVLASAYGDNAGNSPACAVLQSSIAANLASLGTGGMIKAPPSPTTSLFGGEFKNSDPSGASGMTERCDVAIDLGQQDSQNNGVFPNATIFIGQNYPPATDNSSMPGSSTACVNTFNNNIPCAFAYPAAAVVGKVQNQFVIFVKATGVVTLPEDNMGLTTAMTQLGIYLFQKTQ